PPRFAVRLDDGRSFAVHQRVIVGRAPQRVSRDDSDAVLVNIEDGSTIAPSHFAVTWHDGRLLVEDLGSAGGSTVVSPSGVQTRITNAAPMQVGDGWVVVFGARRAQVSLV
ncbi:MAG: FHA domain-containing protein, partial [Acidimicrobiales bacterium]